MRNLCGAPRRPKRAWHYQVNDQVTTALHQVGVERVLHANQDEHLVLGCTV
jgi:hypothetical protein